jgi:hypothetical protein
VLFRSPDEIVAVTGRIWFHGNVIEAVDFWRIFRNVTLKISRDGLPADYHSMTDTASFATLFMSALFLAGGVSLCGVYGFLPELGAVLLAVETALQIQDSMLGYDNRRKSGAKVDKKGTGKLHTMPHPEFGWVNVPGMAGDYENEICKTMTYKWNYEHDMEGCRLTSPGTEVFDDRPVIHVIGCSITYGQSVNDHETYPWRLQKRFDRYRIKNYGVGAYSLLQIYLRLKATIERDHPKAVVLGFHQELEQRNTNPYKYRMYWLRNFKSPSCVSVRRTLRIRKPEGYARFPLPFSNRIRSVGLLEYLYNRLRFRGRGNPVLMRKTNEHLLFQIRALCERNGAALLIACIDNSESYYGFFDQHGFSWCITGVSSRDLDKWTMYPYDGHPNAVAHERNADVISSALENVLSKKHAVPEAAYLLDMKTDTERTGGFIYPHF